MQPAGICEALDELLHAAFLLYAVNVIWTISAVWDTNLKASMEISGSGSILVG